MGDWVNDAMRKLVRIFLAVILTMLYVLTTNGIALAHARLLRSNPEDGAIMAEAPQEVYLWFDEPIAVEFSSIELLDANTKPVGEAVLRGDPSDPTLVVASMPGLQAGVYSLTWKVLSNTDNHFTRGTLVFGIGQTVEVTTRQPAQAEVSIPTPEVTLRALNYATLAALIGSLLVVAVILRSNSFDASTQTAANVARQRIWLLGFSAAVLGLIVGFGWLAQQSAAVGRNPFDLLATRFGALWLTRQFLLLIVLIIISGGGRRE